MFVLPGNINKNINHHWCWNSTPLLITTICCLQIFLNWQKSTEAFCENQVKFTKKKYLLLSVNCALHIFYISKIYIKCVCVCLYTHTFFFSEYQRLNTYRHTTGPTAIAQEWVRNKEVWLEKFSQNDPSGACILRVTSTLPSVLYDFGEEASALWEGLALTSSVSTLVDFPKMHCHWCP